MSYKGMSFYFMRHGETYLNHYERIQGWSDAPLTESGKKGVTSSGRGLADIKFDAIYTSDLTRTVETAKLVMEENEHAKKLEVNMMPEFREVFFGSFEGLPIEQVNEMVSDFKNMDTPNEFFDTLSIPQQMNAYREADPYGHAEDFMTFWLRIEQGLLDIVNRHKDTDDTVLVVVHGLVIRYLIMALIPEVENRDYLTNASITRVQYRKGRFIMDSYNETSHFKEMLEQKREE